MRLQWNFGLQKTALDERMTSFLTGRTQQVAYIGQLSPILPVLYGVPQGSVLGPLLSSRSLKMQRGLSGSPIWDEIRHCLGASNVINTFP